MPQTELHLSAGGGLVPAAAALAAADAGGGGPRSALALRRRRRLRVRRRQQPGRAQRARRPAGCGRRGGRCLCRRGESAGALASPVDVGATGLHSRLTQVRQILFGLLHPPASKTRDCQDTLRTRACVWCSFSCFPLITTAVAFLRVSPSAVDHPQTCMMARGRPAC